MPRKIRKVANKTKNLDCKQGLEIKELDQSNSSDSNACCGSNSVLDDDESHFQNGNLCEGLMSPVIGIKDVEGAEENEKLTSKTFGSEQLVNGNCEQIENEETFVSNLKLSEEDSKIREVCVINGDRESPTDENFLEVLSNEVTAVDFKDENETTVVREATVINNCAHSEKLKNESAESQTFDFVEDRTLNVPLLNEISSDNLQMHENYHSNDLNSNLVEIKTISSSILQAGNDHELKNEIIVLQENLKNQLSEIIKLKEENGRLRNSSVNCDTIPLAETTVEIYEVQMTALENTITQLQKEVDHYRDKMTEQDEFTRTTIYTLRKDLSKKLEQMTKQYEISEKEKESMVVKYALSEKAVLSTRKNLEEVDKKWKEGLREKETLQGKIRALTNEKARINQSLDSKINEVSVLQRDAERTKDEIASRDIKIKWAQNKLKTEIDAHKDTQVKVERLEHKLKEAREESAQIRKDCQAMIRTYQESEEIKSNSLDLQLREKLTELELERQEKCDQEEVYVVMQRELEGLKKKHKTSIEENNSLSRKVQTLERERLDYEENLGKLKEQVNEGHQELADSNARVAELQNLSTQIEREREKVAQSWNEIERLRQTNAELQIDMETCRRKEGELLEFTERLTSKNVNLVSDYNCLEAKFNEKMREANSMKKKLEELETKCIMLESQVSEEQQQRKIETQLLARKLAEKTKIAEILNLKVEEHNNENQVLKKKNSFTVRELTREVQTLRRRLESYELLRNGHQEGQNLGSRTSSTGSLDKLGFSSSSYQPSGSMNKVNYSVETLPDSKTLTDTPLEPTRQLLIERIVKLQWAHARKNEKIEFLEEHVSQLLKEIQRKSKLIQNYIMREDTGALATSSMDVNKVELAKKGGIMSSLYLSQANDDGMTLDLSLEISQKLQAVLEDTLLKNITLKENIKMLGEEIERLTREQNHIR